MSIGSIQQGELSAKQGDGGVYSERLKAFQESYVRPEFTDIAKEYNDVINADKIKAEKFSQAVLNSKVAPSTSKMYESHFQIAKDKFDILYDDETLNHFSKDEAGMRKWSELVDQLNRDIEMYEQVYEDSYGDPSRATGDGYTWADYQARAKSFNGDEQGWFNAQGFRSNNPNSAIETMKSIDSKQHNNLTFDFESGTFDYDVSDGFDAGFLEPTDPNVAYNIFSYQTEQDRFSTATDFTQNIWPTFTSYGEDAAKEKVSNLRTQNSFILSAISSYQNKLDDDAPEKNLRPQDYRKILEESGTLDDALDDFEADVIEAAKQRKRREDAKNKPKDPTDPTDTTLNTQPFTLIDEIPRNFYSMSGVQEKDSDIVKIGFSSPVYLEGISNKLTEVYYDKIGEVFYAYNPNAILYQPVQGVNMDTLLKDGLNTKENLTEFISGESTSVTPLEDNQDGVGSNY